MAAAKGGNSKLIIGIVVVVLLALLGFGAFKFLKKGASTMVPGGSQSGNVFTSIKDALSKSVSLQCDYSDANGIKTTAYIKAGAIRSDTTGKTPEESGSAIIKDKKMYFWNSQGGFTMDFKDTETTAPSTAPSKSGGEKPQDIMNSLEQYKDSCKPAVVSDSLFTPPANVKFQDFSQMFKTPTGGAGVPAFNEKDIQKYLPQGGQAPSGGEQ